MDRRRHEAIVETARRLNADTYLAESLVGVIRGKNEAGVSPDEINKQIHGAFRSLARGVDPDFVRVIIKILNP